MHLNSKPIDFEGILKAIINGNYRTFRNLLKQTILGGATLIERQKIEYALIRQKNQDFHKRLAHNKFKWPQEGISFIRNTICFIYFDNPSAFKKTLNLEKKGYLNYVDLHHFFNLKQSKDKLFFTIIDKMIGSELNEETTMNRAKLLATCIIFENVDLLKYLLEKSIFSEFETVTNVDLLSWSLFLKKIECFKLIWKHNPCLFDLKTLVFIGKTTFQGSINIEKKLESIYTRSQFDVISEINNNNEANCWYNFMKSNWEIKLKSFHEYKNENDQDVIESEISLTLGKFEELKSLWGISAPWILKNKEFNEFIAPPFEYE